MIKSMTGYGRCSRLLDGHNITVEVKSINHRNFELSPRVPRSYGFMEEKLKSYIQKFISHGKVDVYVSVTAVNGLPAEVSINRPLLESYLKAYNVIAEDYGLTNDVTVATLARNDDLFILNSSEEDNDTIWALVRQVLDESLVSFNKMRETEGQRLADDMLMRCGIILDSVSKIETLSAETVNEYEQKLEAKVREMLADRTVDEGRLLTEVALFADRVSVTEELVRLRSHVAQFSDLLKEDVANGRKMDFLIQEMNREINTTASKSRNTQIARLVVDVKSEIEKIREQTQNIE